MPKGLYHDDILVDPSWGSYLRLRRRREHRTQRQAAAIIGISPRTLEAFERSRLLRIRRETYVLLKGAIHAASI